MTIAILPARLANQIAAGEVVERPASVIKELVENSLDAGATNINIDVDKGGVKRIRISDNGKGIAKDELTLALSRHATSKIKDLRDLEGIASLGFRGEALASISSVSRLTLTSKPPSQATPWQANAEGRDMSVTVKPAAHGDGTTIEVTDLFFNTPARRKFLRTEKTEFNHIDEVIRRIALARFDVSFSLTHNSKLIRQYRAAQTKAQHAKRVAMVCGPKFVEHAIEVNCQHDDMIFSGWLAKPSFARNQNDLCYSYVNGRMMRDKLINHAIRQAYADLLAPDTHPAFVLFLTLNHREVDVNVHPAKHEVRFHQSRYVHDFIYSVCHNALMENSANIEQEHVLFQPDHQEQPSVSQVEQTSGSVAYQRPDYIAPLQQVKESSYQTNSASTSYGAGAPISKAAVANYQQLLTPSSQQKHELNSASESPLTSESSSCADDFFVALEQGQYGIFKQQQHLRLLSLSTLASAVHKNKIRLSWQQSEEKPNKGLISQPLLLPVSLTLSEQQFSAAQTCQASLALAGIVFTVNNHGKQANRIQIRQYPAMLRNNDVTASFTSIIDKLSQLAIDSTIDEQVVEKYLINALANVMVNEHYSESQANSLWLTAKKTLSKEKIESILLNSIALDLTSVIKQLENTSRDSVK